MIERLIRWGVPRYLGGPSRSWVFTSVALLGYRLAKRSTGRREIIDIGSVGKGKQIVIDHVPDSHAKQLKGEKKAKKAAKRDKRAARKVRRVERRARRRVSRDERQVARAERKAGRVERRAAKAAASSAGS